MRRADTHDEQAAGQDSFLDVVANIVGILILLVMVVGLRTARRSQEQVESVQTQAPAVTDADVREATKLAQAEHRNFTLLTGHLEAAELERRQADAERVDLASYVASAQAENEQNKQRLSESQRRDVEMRRELAATQLRLEELTREQVSLASFEPQVKTIESLPTPLAKTVSGEELHIRLAAGKAAVIPLKELVEQYHVDAEANVYRLHSRETIERVVGPVEGFRLRYQLMKFEMTAPNGGRMARVLGRWELLPDATAAGEPVGRALDEDSRLMTEVARITPQSTTVTIWTYSDSFNEFRELKRALYERGYATAGRPLPDGVLIGGSPFGSQSASQ